MWDNTLLIVIGDNGAPSNNAGYNGQFKGFKFTHWEGGHRVPSFVSGGALTDELRGSWYNHTIHFVDLHRTILDLAGLSTPEEPAAVKPHDGVSLGPWLNLSQGLDTPLRDELWIANDVRSLSKVFKHF